MPDSVKLGIFVIAGFFGVFLHWGALQIAFGNGLFGTVMGFVMAWLTGEVYLLALMGLMWGLVLGVLFGFSLYQNWLRKGPKPRNRDDNDD